MQSSYNILEYLQNNEICIISDLFWILFMCCFQVRFSSSNIPKCLIVILLTHNPFQNGGNYARAQLLNAYNFCLS